MTDELELWLTSPKLYKRTFLYLNDHDGSGEMPERFKPDVRFCFALVPTTFVEKEVNTFSRKNPDSNPVLFDDCYHNVRHFSTQGMKTIWFNPEGNLVEDDLPRHDGEIQSLDEVAKIFSLLHNPSLAQCRAWLDAWAVPDNVRRHSSVVARSAYILAVKMQNRGIAVDPILAHRAGLVHDIDKIETLNKSSAHGNVGASFFVEQGYPQIAKIVREHIMSTILDPDAADRSWENKLVFFCDKLVEGDQLVPFDQRLAALRTRYPEYMAAMQRAEKPIWDLSDEICEILGLSSHEDLIEMLRAVL
ncbi:MAG: HDIG domain-containing protein [Chloroflexota bacterium]|nr:HDIG domain-containing protein [Chloroflexota bacterium]